MKFKAVLFDLDNTLIDFVKFKEVCINSAVDGMIKAGLKMSKAEAIKHIIETYKQTSYEDPQVFQKFLLKACGDIDYKILAAGIVEYRKARPNVMKPYRGVKRTLKKLKEMGLKLGIVTDAPKIKAWLRLTYLGIPDFFDIILAYGDFKEKKPSSEPFKMAMKKLKVKPEETIFVGDNPKRDIVGANKMGMVSVLGKYGLFKDLKLPKNPKKWERPDYVIDKISNLIDIVKQENQKNS